MHVCLVKPACFGLYVVHATVSDLTKLLRGFDKRNSLHYYEASRFEADIKNNPDLQTSTMMKPCKLRRRRMTLAVINQIVHDDHVVDDGVLFQ